jgi:hypothetical protein
MAASRRAPASTVRRSAPVLVGLLVLAGALGAGARDAAGAGAVTVCPQVLGYALYANGVGCPTAKKLVRQISARPYRAPKATIRNIPGWVCVASYSRKTRKQLAGSCLRRGTVATGFGWTRNGATVPLPPGASPPPPPPPAAGG